MRRELDDGDRLSGSTVSLVSGQAYRGSVPRSHTHVPRPEEGVAAGETPVGVYKRNESKSPAVNGVGGGSEKPELAV